MKVALLNFFDTHYAPVGAISVPNKEAYARRHGYDYLLEHATLAPERPASWNKLRLIQKYIGRYDIIFWNDTDTLIMNPEITLESLVLPGYPIVVGSDDWGINCGNFLVRNEPGIAAILEEWWDKDDEIEHPWWEQRALMELLRTRPAWAKRVGVQPEAVMNSHLNHYREGDFLIHFAGFGRDLERLVAIMEVWS